MFGCERILDLVLREFWQLLTLGKIEGDSYGRRQAGSGRGDGAFEEV
jgi:hypothetical protein